MQTVKMLNCITENVELYHYLHCLINNNPKFIEIHLNSFRKTEHNIRSIKILIINYFFFGSPTKKKQTTTFM